MARAINDELLWTAYRYSVGELSDEAARWFEERLAGDPAACEALAEAVKLEQAVRAAMDLRPVLAEMETDLGEMETVVPVVAVGGRLNRAPVAVWIMVATAACVALVVGWQKFRPADEGASQEIAEAQADSDSRLLAALGPEHSWDAPASLVSELSIGDEVDAEDYDPAERAVDDMDVTAPDWLLAAVVESSTGGNE